MVELNTAQTSFVDLSANKQDPKHSDNNEDKKSDEWYQFYMFFHDERYSALFVFSSLRPAWKSVINKDWKSSDKRCNW